MDPTYYPLVVWVYGINRRYHDNCILADVLRGGRFASVSNGAQYVGRNAPGLIDRGAHETLSITYH